MGLLELIVNKMRKQPTEKKARRADVRVAKNGKVIPHRTAKGHVGKTPSASIALARGVNPKYKGICNERGFPIYAFLVPCPVCHRRALKQCKHNAVCQERNRAFLEKCRTEDGWYNHIKKEVRRVA